MYHTPFRGSPFSALGFVVVMHTSSTACPDKWTGKEYCALQAQQTDAKKIFKFWAEDHVVQARAQQAAQLPARQEAAEIEGLRQAIAAKVMILCTSSDLTQKASDPLASTQSASHLVCLSCVPAERGGQLSL